MAVKRKKILIVAVVGSRSFHDYPKLRFVLSDILVKNETLGYTVSFVSGGAQGADRLAERFARQRERPIEVIRPDWERHGRGAGFVRNKTIVHRCDMLIAFWDGHSRGTQHSMNYASSMKKQVICIKGGQ